MAMMTQSVCPVCLKRIPAANIKRNGNVYLEKKCPEHGLFSTLIWEGETPSFSEWGGVHKATRPLTNEGVSAGCPYDCGICGQHRQRTCCCLFEITQRCNLRCPVCFADAGGDYTDPGLDTIAMWYDSLLKKGGRANVQLSGGEPTVRDDLPEIISMGYEKGFTYFQLNTNGLRLAQEDGYAKKLKTAGLSCVFLQFDGMTDDVFVKMRGRALLDIKKQAIKNCIDAGLSVVLVPTVAADVNLDQVGDIIKFAMENLPYVKGVHFQPMSYFGRYSGEAKERVTLPRLLREIESQTDGLFKISYFGGASAEHSRCSFSGNFLLHPDGTVESLKTEGCCCGSSEEDSSEQDSCCCGSSASAQPAETEVEHNRDVVARRWGSDIKKIDKIPEDMNSLDGLLYLLSQRRFSISGMVFQDCWNLDLERLRDCYINIMSPEGNLIPFCAYNLTDVNGHSLYRKHST